MYPYSHSRQSRFGNFLSDAVDAVGDVATSVVDKVGDAGHEIGSVLQTLAPIISLIPGYGTVIGAAFYAAGAIAEKQKIDDALIGTTAIAIPAGIPRIAFTGAANVTEDMAHGRNTFGSIVATCRQFAEKSGPQAKAAFEAGLSVGRGQQVDQATIDAGHAQAQTQGIEVTAAYDTGVGLAQHESAPDILVHIGHDYATTQGPLVAGAFDTGIALGTGKTLQEAGYAGLKVFIAGNDSAERVFKFVDAVSRAHNATDVPGIINSALPDGAVQAVLTSDLAGEIGEKLQSLGANLGEGAGGLSLDIKLKPYLDAIKSDPSWLTEPAEAMVQNAGDEVFARAAQVLLRDGNGQIDKVTLDLIYPAASIGRSSEYDANGDRYAANTTLAAFGRELIDADYPAFVLRNMKSWGLQQVINEDWRRGYDIGTAVSAGHYLPGPNQDAIRNSLKNLSKIRGFDSARKYQYAKTLNVNAANEAQAEKDRILKEHRASNDQYAKIGKSIADANAIVDSARNFSSDRGYQRGFDIGTALSVGQSQNGPAKDLVLASLSPMNDPQSTLITQAGFQDALQLQFALTLSGVILNQPGTESHVIVQNTPDGIVKVVTAAGLDLSMNSNPVEPHQPGIFVRFFHWLGF